MVREGAEIWRDLDLRLTDRRRHVRTAAAYAVAQFGAELPEAVPRLIQLLERDPEPDPRAYAVVALGAIGPAVRSALPALEAAAKSADMRIPGWAGQAIEKIRVQP
ncbi:MAG: HEAT repeat domain-containing protein [Deltaproteobacteria bacterium]|nr:HEAT repeat domain-containing protein [Deltaproteobacteria bacterium]